MPNYSNLLLQSLSQEDINLLLPHLVHLELPQRLQIEHTDQPIAFVYFLESGIASTTYGEEIEVEELEVFLTGREGMTGLAAVLGDGVSPNETYMQAPGAGFRIEVEPFVAAVERSQRLRQLVNRFTQYTIVQITQTVVANRMGKLEARLARWLLMASDRTDGPVLIMTHDFLAAMLGVNRPGVTNAIHALEAVGLIKADRAHIQIADRPGLITFAGNLYGIPEREYERLIGRPFARPIPPI
jgi:CRP-like cAMP-binding protein